MTNRPDGGVAAQQAANRADIAWRSIGLPNAIAVGCAFVLRGRGGGITATKAAQGTLGPGSTDRI